MVFNFINNNSIMINYLEFIQTQKKINEKFPNPNKKFINIFDNMVGQINEEIFECKEALYKNQMNHVYQDNDSIEEFIDAFMYIGSLLCEISNNLKFDLEEFLIKNKLDKIIINNDYIDNNYIDNDMPSSEFLAWVRRIIYNRKYHKKASNKPNNYEELLIKSILIGGFQPSNIKSPYACPKFISNLNPYLNNLLFCYGDVNVDDKRIKMIPQRISQLNEILSNKQNYIINL